MHYSKEREKKIPPPCYHVRILALVAQLDRVSGYEPEGQRFESSPVRSLRLQLSFSVERFPCGPLGNNTYVLSSSGEAIVIDPALGCYDTILSFLKEKNLSLKAIWITHSHLDHFAGSKPFVDTFNVPIAVHALDAPNLEKPGKDLIELWMECPPVKPSLLLKDKDTLCCGKSLWTMLHTPGHSPGSICFYNAEEKAIFTGDTLFRGTYGKCSFPTSDATLMAESLYKLSDLPEETIVYPGHGPKTTIGREKKWMRTLLI